MANEKSKAEEKDVEERSARAKAAQAEAQEAEAAEAQESKAEEKSVPSTALDPVVAFANSGTAATGEQVEIPKTPKEIAKEGSELGAAGDFSTGGIVPPVEGRASGGANAPVFQRVWAMDADHTTNNRHLPDTFKPDCSVRTN